MRKPTRCSSKMRVAALAPLFAASAAGALLAGCGGDDSPAPAPAPAPAPVALTCDNSMITAFKPDANTTVTLVKAFKKAGFGVVTPHVDVMTFNRWMAKGYRPMEGSKSLKIRNLRLFHKTQVRSITPEERAELEAQSAAAVARHQAEQAAKVVPIHAPQ